MEYREGRCPKCKEVMQIPANREKVICMFCGHEFRVAGDEAAGQGTYEAELAAFSGSVDSFFEDVDRKLKGFKRYVYEENFQAFLANEQENFRRIRGVMYSAPDWEKAGQEVARVLVESARRSLDARKSKIRQESNQVTMNMYMVTFILPGLLTIDDGRLSDLTEEICTQWAAAFKHSNIRPADFETLKSGFKRKLCYITGAVCEGLNKPQDCYELNLLKKYRDGYLATAPGGEELIAQYYDMAPTIVRRMEKQKDRDKIYRYLYEVYIKPCVHLIEEEKNEACREKYEEMVEMLRERYM